MKNDHRACSVGKNIFGPWYPRVSFRLAQAAVHFALRHRGSVNIPFAEFKDSFLLTCL